MLTIILLLACLATAQGQSKMIAELAPLDRRLSEESKPPLEAVSVTYLEQCSPAKPVTFPLSGGEGKGFVGLMDNTNVQISMEIISGNGGVHLEDTKYQNVFGAINNNEDDGTSAMPFAFADVPKEGGQAEVYCDEPVFLFIAYHDRTDFTLKYEVTTKPGNGSRVANGAIALVDVKADKALSAKPLSKNKDKGERRLVESSFVDVHDETETGVEFDSDTTGDIVLVQVELVDPLTGNKVFRSIITETRTPPSPVQPMILTMAEVDDLGDLHLYFQGLPTGNLFLKALISVESNNRKSKDLIEIKAMTENGELVLHGGWIRTGLEKANGNRQQPSGAWKLTVIEALALDPQDSYTKVAELMHEAVATIAGKNAHLLSQKPSKEEQELTDEMKNGRRPSTVRGGARQLQGIHRKILVHGYCSDGNPFPMNQFTNAVAFQGQSRRLGSTSGKNNWSHDEFARKIRDFANSNGIVGCGIIAHSQGGAAALHLYTYYWSCLDYANQGGTRLIQSVGTPYRGTALAGNLASVGDVFGAGCGYNNDLTESGADAWLSNIPTWARSKVNYYSTSFTWRWWAYDYCHLVTDPFLSDPEDGTVTQARAQLSGGNNRGHKTGWCHTPDMRDPAQCSDGSRNSVMNNDAFF